MTKPKKKLNILLLSQITQTCSHTQTFILAPIASSSFSFRDPLNPWEVIQCSLCLCKRNLRWGSCALWMVYSCLLISVGENLCTRTAALDSSLNIFKRPGRSKLGLQVHFEQLATRCSIPSDKGCVSCCGIPSTGQKKHWPVYGCYFGDF